MADARCNGAESFDTIAAAREMRLADANNDNCPVASIGVKPPCSATLATITFASARSVSVPTIAMRCRDSRGCRAISPAKTSNVGQRFVAHTLPGASAIINASRAAPFASSSASTAATSSAPGCSDGCNAAFGTSFAVTLPSCHKRVAWCKSRR